MSQCCGRRVNDGVIDSANISRGFSGENAALSPDEFRILVAQLNRVKGWGLKRIADHTGRSRSLVAQVLKDQRGRS